MKEDLEDLRVQTRYFSSKLAQKMQKVHELPFAA